jgi:hypothetical protein
LIMNSTLDIELKLDITMYVTEEIK